MQKHHLIETFELKPEELSLRILIWSAEQLETDLENATIVPKEQLEKILCFSSLDYSNQSYDLCICDDVLFDEPYYNLLGDDQKVIDAHSFILQEFCRVAGEVRVFPITSHAGKPSKYLGPVLKLLQEKGLGEELRQIPNAEHEPLHAILKVFNKDCDLKI